MPVLAKASTGMSVRRFTGVQGQHGGCTEFISGFLLNKLEAIFSFTERVDVCFCEWGSQKLFLLNGLEAGPQFHEQSHQIFSGFGASAVELGAGAAGLGLTAKAAAARLIPGRVWRR